VGINCGQKSEDFPPEIRSFAGSLSMITGREIAIGPMAAAMINALHRMDQALFFPVPVLMRQYRADCMTVGHDVSLVRGDEVRHGHAIGITDCGALVVRFADGHTEAVNSGEVSVRGLYGYV
jgi:BirA family biotin operon repressor/biotin-[acetyl-CoA-carboxylase] ligase